MIGIIGRGLVGSIFKDMDGYEVVSHNEWEPKIANWSGVVNCAALSSQRACDNATAKAVNDANVLLPSDIAKRAARLDIPFIQFSTSAVYKWNGGNPVKETDARHPHNSYAGSKMLMENILSSSLDTYIFRIPGVYTGSGADNDLPQKVARWEKVEDAEMSIVTGETIREAVHNVMEGNVITGNYSVNKIDSKNLAEHRNRNPAISVNKIASDPSRIYNISSYDRHLPNFVKEETGREIEKVPACSLGLTPPIVLNTEKAEAAEIL